MPHRAARYLWMHTPSRGPALAGAERAVDEAEDRTFHAGRKGRRAVAAVPPSLRPLWASLPLVCGCLAPQHAAAQVAPGTGQPPTGGTTVNLGTIPVTASAPLTIGQQPDAEGINNFVTTRNRTGGKADLPASSVAQDIVAVPQKVIQDQAVINRQEALQNVAGVSPSAVIQNGDSDGNVLIRGFAPAGFLRNGFFDEGAGINTYLPWVGDAERIEVLKGASALLWGPSVFNSGIGGIVNLVTKLPLTTPHYAIGAAGDTQGAWYTNIDISHPLTADKTWLARFIGEINDQATFVDHYRIAQRVGVLTVQGLLDPQTSLTLTAEWIHQQNNQYFGLPAYGTILPAPAASPFKSFPLSFNSSDPRSVGFYDGGRLQAVAEHRFSDAWDLRVALGYNYGNRDARQYFISPSGNYATSGLWTEQYNHTTFQSSTYYEDTTLNGKFSTYGLKHDLVLGIQALSNSVTVANRNGSNVGPALNPVSLWFSSYGRYQVFMHEHPDLAEVTAYANDVISLTDRLKLSAGVSFIFYRIYGTYQVPATTPSYNSNYSGVATRVGPIYEVLPHLFAFADYGTSFTPQFPVLESNGTVYANVTPLTGEQVEVGLKYELPNVATITLAAYQITEKNVETSDPVNPNVTLLSGVQRSRGLELDGAYHLKPGWDLITAFAYTDAVVVKDNTLLVGSALANVPHYSGRVFSVYEVQDGRFAGLGFGGGVTFATDRTADIPTRAAKTVGRLGGYATVDALLYYKLAGWRASMNVTNLLDNRYYYSGQSLQRIYPGQPFTALFRLSKEF